MPDQYGFDHLPNWGVVSHRCIECDFPGHGVVLSEAQRRRHHLTHTRTKKRELDKERLANLAKARRTKRMIEKEAV